MGMILVCENSLEGVFSGIYEAYARHLPHEETRLLVTVEFEPLLFWEHSMVDTN